MPTAVFRCDASPTIGAGHVYRSMVVADALWSLDWKTVFVSQEGTKAVVPVLADGPHELLEVDRQVADEPDSIARMVSSDIQLVVVDHYGLDLRYEEKCRRMADQLLVIDDLADRNHCCDALLDQARADDDASYISLCPNDCRMLLGPSHALLRSQFRDRRRLALARRRELKQIDRVLVSFGATDGRHLVPVTLQSLANVDFRGQVDVVMSAQAQSIAEARSLASKMPFAIRILTDVADMADLMTQADFAIGAAGGTTWERCCLGLPVLMVTTNSNQDGVADVVATAGGAVHLGAFDTVTGDDISAAFEKAIDDRSGYDGLSTAAFGICDGLGVGRVLNALLPELGRDGAEISLRCARLDDAKTVYRWQSHPETRRYFHERTSPSWDEHMSWFSARLESRNDIYRIIVKGDKPAGVLRLDVRDDGDYTVSILVDPDQKQRGVGLAALRLGRKLLPHVRLVAEVSPDNQASVALFEAAGYRDSGSAFESLPRAA